MSDATVFKSRWLELPSGVHELDCGVLPAGFRSAGVHCGLKRDGLDLGLLHCESPDVCSAARFTRNGVVAAPVELNLAEGSLDTLRAVIVNSGNANVCTGAGGRATARTMRDQVADQLGLHHTHVAVASTGLIGAAPNQEAIAKGIGAVVPRLSNQGGAEFAEAILTTDSGTKTAAVTVDVAGSPVVLSAQIKGAGMIAPGMSSATMLCFVETDACVEISGLELELDRVLASTLERVSVDGQLSTNDSFFFLASGESGVDCTKSALFFDALEAILLQLALAMAADGEGATRVVHLLVRGAHGQEEAEAVARAVADSPLVKTAVFGADANWGRFLQAAGAALGRRAHRRESVRPSLWFEGFELCRRGEASVDAKRAEQVRELMGRDEVEYLIDLHRGESSYEIYFSDLGYDYVKLNAEYET